MKVKLLASTELNLNEFDWPEDTDENTMDHTWSVNEYKSHPFISRFEEVEGSNHVQMNFEGGQEKDADELAEIAGRLCYKSWSRPNPGTATNQGYIQNIIGQQHFSVLEHASATFWISGVSRSLTHELVRHRHLSFSQVSQRYVDESEGEWIYHPAIEAAESGYPSNILMSGVVQARDDYDRIVKYLVASGVDRKTARGAARGVLPNAVATELIVSGNHRTWREVLQKRLSPGADAEIRLLASLLLSELRRLAPNTYQDFEEVK